MQVPSTSCYIPIVHNENAKNGKEQSMPSTSGQSEKLVDPYNDTSVKENHAIAPSLSDVPHEMSRCISTPKSNFVELDPAAKVSWHKREPDGKPITRQLEDVVISSFLVHAFKSVYLSSY